MNEVFIMNVKGLLKSHIIKCTLIDSEHSFYNFVIDNSFNVSKNHKGWLCDYTETDEEYLLRVKKARYKGWLTPVRWGCCLDLKGECFHIFACKCLVNDDSVRMLVKGNSSLSEAVRLGRLHTFGQPQHQKEVAQ